MCGIIGYLGPNNGIDVVFDGLSRLEYRGYDSAGIATLEGNTLSLRKTQGKMQDLKNLLRESPLSGNTCIGHTRWATHGVPSRENAHPHVDNQEKVAVVHNGIIENYEALRTELRALGCEFKSDTDTEVLPFLIAHYMKDNDFETAFHKTIKRLEGAYAIAAISVDNPDFIMGTRKGSPMVLGLKGVAEAQAEFFLASDVPAVIEHTRDFIYLEEGDCVRLTRESYDISDDQGKAVSREVCHVDLDIQAAEKQGYDHFMLKEIYEQPTAIRETLRDKILPNNAGVKFDNAELLAEKLPTIRNIITVSCGTAWHAGLVGKYAIEELAQIPVEVRMASEFRYGNPVITPETLIIAVSQSGETADTLEGVRRAKEAGATVLCVCNVMGSSLTRLADISLFTHAGPEIGVASTKAYTTQLSVLFLLAMYMGEQRGVLSAEKREALLAELQTIPDLIPRILEDTSEIKRVADKYSFVYNFMFIGRNYSYPTAAEGALKLKEISYIHAEGYAAGEMKHGPLALVDELFPTIAIAPGGHVHGKMISNIQEIIARRGKVVAIIGENDTSLDELVPDLIRIPEATEMFSAILAVIPAQLFAYYIALNRGCDVDQPRNLAKSVTVE